MSDGMIPSSLLPTQVVLDPWADAILLPSLLALASAWREPEALRRAASSTGALMLGKRQLGGWTASEGAEFLDALGPEGRALYGRYTSFTVSLVWTSVFALQIALALRRGGRSTAVASSLPLIFTCLNLLQDRCVATFLSRWTAEGERRGGRDADALALMCGWVTRFKFASLVVCLFLAPIRLLEAAVVILAIAKFLRL